MNKYIQVPAGASGFTNFLSGFGREQRRVHAVEQQMQAAADTALGQNIGQGIGNAASSYMSRKNALTDAATAHTYGMEELAARTNAQQGIQDSIYQRQMDLEQSRSDNDMLEKVYAGFLSPGGNKTASRAMGGGASFTGAPDMAMEPIGMNEDGSPIMPEQPEATVPAPSVNPAMTPQYRKAQEDFEQIRASAIKAYSDPYMSKQDKIALGLRLQPAYRQAEFMMQAQPQQKPPTTIGEMRAAGVLNGGVTDVGDGSMLIPKGMTRAMGSKTENVDRLLSWRELPDPVARKAAKRQYIEDAFVGDYTAFEARGGYGEIDMTTGKVQFIEPKEKNDDDKEAQDRKKEADKRLERARADAAKNKAENDRVEKESEAVLSNPEADPEDRKIALRNSFEKLPTDPIEILKENKVVEHRALLTEFSPRTITMDEYRALGEKILADWGGDPNNVPPALADEVRKLGWKLRGEREP